VRLGLSGSLLIVNIAALLLIVLAESVAIQPLLIILGIPFLLFFPGFALMAAIAPQRDSVGTSERLILSFVLSLALVPIAGLIVNYAWEISLASVLVSNGILVVAASVVAWLRMSALLGRDRAVIEFNFGWPGRDWSGADGPLTVAMVLVVIVALVVGIYYAVAPKGEESYTQFYIQQQGGGPGYPETLNVGEQGSVTLVVANHEGTSMTYRIQVRRGDQTLDEVGPLDLADGEELREEVTFALGSAGPNQRIDLLLFVDDDVEPYLAPLEIHVDVVG